jgi:hypothetical protein
LACFFINVHNIVSEYLWKEVKKIRSVPTNQINSYLVGLYELIVFNIKGQA